MQITGWWLLLFVCSSTTERWDMRGLKSRTEINAIPITYTQRWCESVIRSDAETVELCRIGHACGSVEFDQGSLSEYQSVLLGTDRFGLSFRYPSGITRLVSSLLLMLSSDVCWEERELAVMLSGSKEPRWDKWWSRKNILSCIFLSLFFRQCASRDQVWDWITIAEKNDRVYRVLTTLFFKTTY